MFAVRGRFLIGSVVVLALLAPAFGAEEGREFFSKPETPAEYWGRVKFEIEVGKFDFAAKYLKGFIDSLAKLKPDEAAKVLVALEEKDGMSAFLRLKQIPELLEDKKARAALRADVNKLLDMVNAAVGKILRDPKRIAKFIKNLSKSREERSWAVNQLARSGAVAVPYLVRELQDTAGKQDHEKVLSAMRQLDDTILPPLLAALDIPDNALRRDILNLIKTRGETKAIPWLWYLSASPRLPEGLRNQAAETIAFLQKTEAEGLTRPKVALTRAADDYYRHRVKFADPAAVTVWKYDRARGELLPSTVTAGEAELYYGLHFARQALDLDPAYRPAQVVFLSLALDKAYGGDVHMPLSRKAPEVKELMKTVNPELLADMLDRALRDGRVGVILGTIQALGDLGDVRAARLGLRGGPVLARALNYPDRRVQLAAADAMLRIPGRPPAVSAGRVVQILRRLLLADPVPRVLVCYFKEDRAESMRKVVQEAGYQPVLVRTRREALNRLKAGADIDAILIDSSFPEWEREFPFVLAEMRADIDTGLLPMVITAPGNRVPHLRRYVERYRNVWVERLDFGRLAAVQVKPRDRQDEKDIIEKARTRLAKLKDKVFENKEQRQAVDKLRDLWEVVERKGADRNTALDLIAEMTRALDAFKATIAKNRDALEVLAKVQDDVADLKGKVKNRDPAFDELERLLAQFSDLKNSLKQHLREGMGRPLSEAERKVYSAVALDWLVAMARGEVKGYDIRPAAEAVYKALRSDQVDTSLAAIEVVGRLAGKTAQEKLAAVLLDPTRDKLRVPAAFQLNRHIQQNGLLLSRDEVKRIQELYATAADPKLKGTVALVIGSMRPSTTATGKRLLEYQPKPAVKEK